MRSLFSILIALVLISACKSTGKLSDTANGEAANAKPQGKVLQGFKSPESVLISRSGMFVSNVGEELEPMLEDGDGYITKLSLEGNLEGEEQFIRELNAPKGMAEKDGILYVADIDQVKAFKAENGEPVQTYDFRPYEARFLNDMVFYTSGQLLITDTELNLIFSLDTKTGDIKKIGIPDDFMGPNGLYFDQVTQILAIVGFGRDGDPSGRVALVYPMDSNDGSLGPFEILDTPTGLLDGVAFVEKKYVIFSDWGEGEGGGRLRYYNTETKETWLINLDNKISGPADFAFDAQNKCLWIPAMKEGKVYQEFLDFY